MFALLVPVFLALGGVVIGIGNWYTHAKHLQTKADAAAFAGGGVWDFPCGASGGPVDQAIEAQARAYAGPHTDATGVVHTSSYNPQVGGVAANKVHVILNGSDWYDNDSNPGAADWTSPTGSVCQSSVLDVKITEDDSFPLASLIPLFPDIKRKARVQIEEVEGVSGLLPVAVRVPKPLSAAAVFYNEDPSNFGSILSVRYFCQDDRPPLSGGILGLPAGLGGWSTRSNNPADPRCASTSWATVNVGPTTGVVIATSFRPACNTVGGVQPCFDDNYTSVNSLCNQGTATQVVQCYYATGTGVSQNVESGLQFIHGYASGAGVTNGPPDINSVWLSAPSLGCSEYFNATTSACGALLNAAIDLGSVMGGGPPAVQTRTPANAEVRYKIVYGNDGSKRLCLRELPVFWLRSRIRLVRVSQLRRPLRPKRDCDPGAAQEHDCHAAERPTGRMRRELQRQLPVVLHRRRPLDEHPDRSVHLRQPAPAIVHGRPHHVGRHQVAAVVAGRPLRRHLHSDVAGRPARGQRDQRHALLLHGDGPPGRALERPGRAADRVQRLGHEPAPAPRLRPEYSAGPDRRRRPHGVQSLLRLEPVRHEPALPRPEQPLQPAQPGRTVGRLAAAAVHEDAPDGQRQPAP